MQRLSHLKHLFIVLLILAATTPAIVVAESYDSPQFRGPSHDGIFPADGLLQSWSEGGPKMLWSTEGLGESYASVSIADGRIYTTGKKGERGLVYALDFSGKVLWSRDYAPEHSGKGYPGSRTTPTYHEGKLYVLSSAGVAAALEAATGKVLWSVDLLEKYGGENTYFGIAESPLIVDDKVIFTAGGKDASLVALHPATGEEIWTTKGLSERSAYCTPRLFDNGKIRQIITFTAGHLIGVDPDDGKVVWKHASKVEYDIHAVSPLFHGNGIYLTHGYNQGGSFVELAEDGKSVQLKWTEEKLDVHHGGPVIVDGVIYGANSKKTWYALDAATGEILASIPRQGKGALIYADGRLYGYVESGDVFLVDPNPKNFVVVGELEIDLGEGQHWSHPVIHDGVLYVRHGGVLMAYDVKKGA